MVSTQTGDFIGIVNQRPVCLRHFPSRRESDREHVNFLLMPDCHQSLDLAMVSAGPQEASVFITISLNIQLESFFTPDFSRPWIYV